MGANFLFDGSAESKEQLKLFLLYSDEGFKISPPVYLRRFFDASSGAEIGNLRDRREYERQLDRAIAFVRVRTALHTRTSSTRTSSTFSRPS